MLQKGHGGLRAAFLAFWNMFLWPITHSPLIQGRADLCLAESLGWGTYPVIMGWVNECIKEKIHFTYECKLYEFHDELSSPITIIGEKEGENLFLK